MESNSPAKDQNSNLLQHPGPNSGSNKQTTLISMFNNIKKLKVVDHLANPNKCSLDNILESTNSREAHLPKLPSNPSRPKLARLFSGLSGDSPFANERRLNLGTKRIPDRLEPGFQATSRELECPFEIIGKRSRIDSIKSRTQPNIQRAAPPFESGQSHERRAGVFKSDTSEESFDSDSDEDTECRLIEDDLPTPQGDPRLRPMIDFNDQRTVVNPLNSNFAAKTRPQLTPMSDPKFDKHVTSLQVGGEELSIIHERDPLARQVVHDQLGRLRQISAEYKRVMRQLAELDSRAKGLTCESELRRVRESQVFAGREKQRLERRFYCLIKPRVPKLDLRFLEAEIARHRMAFYGVVGDQPKVYSQEFESLLTAYAKRK